MQSNTNAPSRSTRPVLAVLYFEPEETDADLLHVACGLTEDVISRLARASGIAEASRHEVVSLRHRDVDTEELGKCMGVTFVLRGDLSAFHDRIRLVVRLAGVGRAGDLWRGTFECETAGLPGVPPAVALGVVKALDVTLSPEEERRMSERLTANARAWDFHARGRESLTLRGRKHTEAALRFFEEAIGADPRFAVAHESLAAACSGMFTYYDGRDGWLDRMAAAAQEALRLDPRLIEARFHVGTAALHKHEYERARAAFEDIIRERPGHYEAYLWLGILFDMTGRYDDALECYRNGAEIKPCSVEPWLYINMTHRRRGDVAGATEAARRFLEVGLRTLHVAPDDPVTLSRFCVIYTLTGEQQKARDTLERILRTETRDGLVLYNCAATYALLGDREGSLECLRKALGEGYKNVRDWIGTDPDFDSIRGAEEFQKLLQEFDGLHRGGSA
jgi:adenylate cyclase